MKIGILGAMDQEVALLLESLDDLNKAKWSHLTFYEGKLHGINVVVVKCGIGKVAASVATTVMIDRYAPDYIINTGSAGGFDANLEIGDIVIGSGVQHHDVDLTHFGYVRGQTYGMPDIFPCDDRLITAAETAAEQALHVKTKRGLICTGDSFIGDDEVVAQLRVNFPAMSAVEMEGAAIGQTCFLLDTPFVVIRSLSDIAGKSSSVSFKEYLDIAAKNSAELVINMIADIASKKFTF